MRGKAKGAACGTAPDPLLPSQTLTLHGAHAGERLLHALAGLSAQAVQAVADKRWGHMVALQSSTLTTALQGCDSAFLIASRKLK